MIHFSRTILSGIIAVGLVSLTAFLPGMPPGHGALAGQDEPFALSTVAVTEGPLAAIWRGLVAKLRSERPVVAQCRANPRTCDSPAALRFIAIVDAGVGTDGLTRLGRINRAVNFSIGTDSAATGQTAWTSPLDALAAGVGDCKQYAVVKYAALQDAGIASDDMRLVIVGMKTLPPPGSMPVSHVVVAVRDRERWVILDNRSLVMVDSGEFLTTVRPLFLLDDSGVRQFAPPSDPQAALTHCNLGSG